MDSQDWDEVKRLFQEALELRPEERGSYLDRSSHGNRAIREEVELLLAQNDRAGNFMQQPVMRPSDSHSESNRLSGGTILELTLKSHPHLAQGTMLLKERYRIERELNRGGFGAVYLARDEVLHNKRVVVKVLLPIASADSSWVADKFEQEVRALSLIDHPGVVGVLDSGFLPDRTPFFVMQYVEGRPLQNLMTEGGMPLEQVAQIVDQIGQALQAAHDKGIWHRDLKPSNIMIQAGRDGGLTVRLIDFGIATITGQERPEAMTRVVGTLSYMAPEQLEGRVTRATDIYSFGLITHEMLTGRKPFPAADPISLTVQQRAGALVDFSSRSPAASLSETERLVRQSLSFRPEDRPPSASLFGQQLARSLAPTAPVPARPRRLLVLVSAFVSGVLALSGFAFWSALHRDNAITTPTLSLSILVQSMLNKKPSGRPSLLPPGAALHPSEAFSLLVKATEQGRLYVLTEDESTGTLSTLFPTLYMYGSSSLVEMNEPKQIPEHSSYQVDPEPSTQILWLVWSRIPLANFEALKRWTDPTDQGEIREAAERVRVRNFLRDSARDLKDERSSPRTQMSIKLSKSQCTWRIPLKIEPDPVNPQGSSRK